MAHWVSDTPPSSTIPTAVSASPSIAVNPKAMPEIPPEIVAEILSHLPAKSLMKFRCVSKPWYALIDSRDFVKMHFKQAQKPGRFHKLVLRNYSGTILCADVDSLDHGHPLKPPFFPSEFSNSCKGLILLVVKNNSLVIWNPFTRKYKTLPPPPVEPQNPPAFYKTKVTNTRYGFGYDSVNGDYKVLRAVSWESSGHEHFGFGNEAKLYSLKSNSWKTTLHSPIPIPDSGRWAAHVNGALHTLVPKLYIIGFDLATEESHQIPLPEGLQVDVFNLTLVALQGLLCLHCKRKWKHSIDMWIMKEYGVKESWAKLLSFAPPLIPTHTSVFPVTFSNSGQEVLLNMNNELIWFDLKRNAFNEVDVRGSRDGDRNQNHRNFFLKRKRKADVGALSVFHAETIVSPDHYGHCEETSEEM